MKRSMRWVISGLAVLGFAHGALAADLDYLRGSEVFAPGPATYSNWSGFYVGGQGGFTLADVTFGAGANALLNSMLTTGLLGTPQLSQSVPTVLKDSATGAAYGGFVGYNTQWENVVLGIEANYNRTSIGALSSTTVPLFLPNIGTGTESSSAHITDYATFRGRFGYIFGRFMPYAMLGVALGRAEFIDSARVQFTPVVNNIPQPNVDVFGSATQRTIGVGYAAGFGLDVLLTDCIFLRGEYEFINFASFGQTRNLVAGQPFDHKVTLNSVRGAIGYKF
jgi:outer membrane immunogenic protein